MLYALERDPERDRKIVQRAEQMKKPVPEKIANAPELAIGLELYWDAFWDLATCRPVGLGAGAIPWSAIRDYAVTFDFDEEQTELLFHCVRVMDNAYLEYYSKKDK